METLVTAALAACLPPFMWLCLTRTGGIVMRTFCWFELLFITLLIPSFWGDAADPQGFGMALGWTLGCVAVWRWWWGTRGDYETDADWPLGFITDYIGGIGLYLLFVYASGVQAVAVHTDMVRWFGGVPRLLRPLIVELGTLLAGFLWSQLVNGAVLRAVNVALKRDWEVSRQRHFQLLAVAFTLGLVPAALRPGLLLGVVWSLLTLYVGWRWTEERPTSTLRTWKLALNRPALDRGSIA